MFAHILTSKMFSQWISLILCDNPTRHTLTIIPKIFTNKNNKSFRTWKKNEVVKNTFLKDSLLLKIILGKDYLRIWKIRHPMKNIVTDRLTDWETDYQSKMQRSWGLTEVNDFRLQDSRVHSTMIFFFHRFGIYFKIRF